MRRGTGDTKDRQPFSGVILHKEMEMEKEENMGLRSFVFWGCSDVFMQMFITCLQTLTIFIMLCIQIYEEPRQGIDGFCTGFFFSRTWLATAQ